MAYNSVRQNYLVVFEYEFSLTDHDIYGRFVNTDGTLSSEFAIATPSAYDLNPIVAYSSALDSYLVVWERRIGDPEFGQKDIYARVVNYDGSFPGSEIALDTTAARRSMRHGLLTNWAGSRLIPLRPASSRPSTGTWITRTGGSASGMGCIGILITQVSEFKISK